MFIQDLNDVGRPVAQHAQGHQPVQEFVVTRLLDLLGG